MNYVEYQYFWLRLLLRFFYHFSLHQNLPFAFSATTHPTPVYWMEFMLRVTIIQALCQSFHNTNMCRFRPILMRCSLILCFTTIPSPPAGCLVITHGHMPTFTATHLIRRLLDGPCAEIRALCLWTRQVCFLKKLCCSYSFFAYI